MAYDNTEDRIQVRFGRNLKAARHRARLTPQEAALQAGVTPEFLLQIEDGTVDLDIVLVAKLADVVSREVHELLK